jgi:transposase
MLEQPPLTNVRLHPMEAGKHPASQIPWDLTEVVDAKTLSAWVYEEIASLDWSNPDLVEHLRVHPNYHPRMMLMVLTYAYSSGVFESEEIIRRCDADPVYRGMCAEAVPQSMSAIRNFRKENRALLKWSLVQMLRRCLAAATGDSSPTLPAGIKRLLVDNSVARLELARHMDRAMHEL